MGHGVMGTRTVIKSIGPGATGKDRVMVKHVGAADVHSEDADLLVERLSEPDGDVLSTHRLAPREHAVFNIGLTTSIRVTQVAKLSAARKPSGS